MVMPRDFDYLVLGSVSPHVDSTQVQAGLGKKPSRENTPDEPRTTTIARAGTLPNIFQSHSSTEFDSLAGANMPKNSENSSFPSPNLPVSPSEDHESRSEAQLLIPNPSTKSDHSAQPVSKSCKPSDVALLGIQFAGAAIPSSFFAGLALDNVRPILFDIPIGQVGAWIETILYPTFSFGVNFATAKPSQAEFVEMFKKLFSSETKNKALYRLSYFAFLAVACVAAIATIPMSDDARKKMHITSENEKLDYFYKVLAIFCLSGLYTVVTRHGAAFGLFTKEIPDFIRWGTRKYYLARTNDPEKRLDVFKEDLECHVNGLSTEKHLRLLSEMLMNQENSITAEQLHTYLKGLGYRMFPTKTKTAITLGLLGGVGPLAPLLYFLALRGANTLGLHRLLAEMVAVVAVAMTLLFYVRAAIKFSGRMTDSFNALTDAFCPNAKKRFLAAYSFMLAVISIATSAGFVYENEKFNSNSSEAVQRATQALWIIYSGLIANGSFTALELGKIGQSRLDKKVVEENNSVSLKANKQALFGAFQEKLNNLRIQNSTDIQSDNTDSLGGVLRLVDEARGVKVAPGMSGGYHRIV